MDCVELLPSFSHCVETVAREEFWSLTSRYMERKQEDEELERKLELLKVFLESTDFKQLRRESEKYLIQGKAVKFILYWEDNKPGYKMVITEERKS